jgi:hypothetical protein
MHLTSMHVEAPHTMKNIKPQRVSSKHIASEYGDSDGYWIDLKKGWKWSGDPVGCVHGIHEDTRRAARAETVLPCDCELCTSAVIRM